MLEEIEMIGDVIGKEETSRKRNKRNIDERECVNESRVKYAFSL